MKAHHEHHYTATAIRRLCRANTVWPRRFAIGYYLAMIDASRGHLPRRALWFGETMDRAAQGYRSSFRFYNVSDFGHDCSPSQALEGLKPAACLHGQWNQ